MTAIQNTACDRINFRYGNMKMYAVIFPMENNDTRPLISNAEFGIDCPDEFGQLTWRHVGIRTDRQMSK